MINENERYLVKYRERADLTWFAPEGESYQCDKKTARERFDVLLSCGRDGVTVYGLYVWQVQIHDLSRPLDGLEWSGQPVLSQYVDDEVPVGEWAEKVAA